MTRIVWVMENVAWSLLLLCRMYHLALLCLSCPAGRMAVAPSQVTAGINAYKVLSHRSKRTLLFKSTSGIKLLLKDSGGY